MIARFLAVLTGLLLLGAAAAAQAGPPWPIAMSRDAITLRWYADEVSENQAQQIAAAHCATTGRRAALGSLELNGSIEIGNYFCR